jgi:hypothetical protein
MTGEERDARLFLHDLYGNKPEGTLIAVGPVTRPHYVASAEDAVPYVVGQRDAYVRMSLLGERPATGRGREEDSVALTVVWADVDVNGGPRSSGGVVQDGARDQGHALELLHAVLQPSLVVCSGYGLHAYWKFAAPWVLADAEARAQAKRLVQGWQARLRREADGLGIANLDAPGDLARVLRPPGSLNGKGPEPAPVVLMDNGGPVYGYDDLDAESIRVDDAPPLISDDDRVRGLLGKHHEVARLVRRTGRAPGDGSGHAWDFSLCCRAAEHGYGDDDLAALVRHARRLHGSPKGERADYVARTVAAARQRVGRTPRERSHEDALAELTGLLGLDALGRQVAGAVVAGHGSEALAQIRLADGYVIDFPRFGAIASSRPLAAQLATTVGVVLDPTPLQARRAAALVRQLAARDRETRDLEQTEAYASELLRLACVVLFAFSDQASKWQTWQRLADHEPEHEATERSPTAYARAVLVAQDTATGQRFVRAGWAQHYVRLQAGATATPTATRDQLVALGWAQRGEKGQIKATDPDGQAPPIRLALYVVPGGWEER